MAAILRLWALGSLPPGLYRDEAFNGLDALGILRGDFSLYFAANNGREPMFMYLIAASVAALGRTPLAVRLPAAFASLLGVPALYLMARALWGQRVGLLSAAVLAVTLWPVHLAHVSFRAGLLPLFLALTAWQAARGWQTSNICHSEAQSAEESRRHWLAAGILYGLSFYTYLAARFTPLALALLAVYAWAVFLRRDAELRRRAMKGAMLFVIAALFTLLPLLLFTFLHWDIVMGRVGQASVFSPAINGGNLPGALIGNTLKALGMFFVQGDRIYRHNVPWRPVFDPVLGACFAGGVILAFWRFKRDAGAALVILWTIVMLLPTILAEDTPHFLRAAGVLPVIAIFPALALDKVWRWLGNQPSPLIPRPVGTPKAVRVRGYPKLAVVGSVLLIGLASTTYDYFVRYPQDPKTAYWFDSAGVSIARDASSVLEAGGRVMIDRRLWDDWVNLRFMVPQDRIRLIGANKEPTPVSDKSSLWIVWPYDDWSRLWPALPQYTQIEVRDGALYQGDKDPKPSLAYITFRTTPYTALPQPRAQFEQFFQLLEANATPDNGGVRVRLVWYAQNAAVQPFTVFVHLMQDGQRVAQGDSAPANGHYPSEAWRPGDVIVDEHWIDWPNPKGGEQVLVGLYSLASGKRLNVLDAAGNPIADSVTLDIK